MWDEKEHKKGVSGIKEELEKASEVIDWEDDLGKMREIREDKWQAFWQKYGGK